MDVLNTLVFSTSIFNIIANSFLRHQCICANLKINSKAYFIIIYGSVNKVACPTIGVHELVACITIGMHKLVAYTTIGTVNWVACTTIGTVNWVAYTSVGSVNWVACTTIGVRKLHILYWKYIWIFLAITVCSSYCSHGFYCALNIIIILQQNINVLLLSWMFRQLILNCGARIPNL